MTTNAIQLEPVVSADNLYLNGMQLSWVSNTTLKVADGACRDSTNSQDIIVATTNAVGTTINGAVNGLNGLDTGSLAASTLYYVYAIMDQSGFNTAGFVISTSSSQPTMPAGANPSGYSNWRLIGAVLTDSSSHFLAFYMSGVNSERFVQYDAPVAVTVPSSGTSATYVAMDLSVAVPAVNFKRVQMQYKYTPAAAGNILNFQPTGATGDAFTRLGIVASVAQEDSVLILPLLATSKPEVSYKVSAGTLNNVYVQGYELSL